MRIVLVVTIVAASASARADSDRPAPPDASTLGAPSSPVAPIVDGGGLAGPSQGQALQLTSEARDGVATYVGTRYAALGHEGRPEMAMTAAVEKHVGATLLRADVAFARELDADQRDAELALSALRAIAARASVGFAGRAVFDLDDGRNDGGEIRWEARGGVAARLRLGGDTRTFAGHCALSLDGGAVAVAAQPIPNAPATVSAGPFVLAAVGGWF